MFVSSSASKSLVDTVEQVDLSLVFAMVHYTALRLQQASRWKGFYSRTQQQWQQQGHQYQREFPIQSVKIISTHTSLRLYPHTSCNVTNAYIFMIAK